MVLQSFWKEHCLYKRKRTPLSSMEDVDGEYRFLVSGNYMVFYRANGNDIYVDRVLYGRRDYLRVLFEKENL